jgi:hypothetical protein
VLCLLSCFYGRQRFEKRTEDDISIATSSLTTPQYLYGTTVPAELEAMAINVLSLSRRGSVVYM